MKARLRNPHPKAAFPRELFWSNRSTAQWVSAVRTLGWPVRIEGAAITVTVPDAVAARMASERRANPGAAA